MQPPTSRVSSVYRRAVLVAAFVLGLKVLGSILWQYRGYFPPDFEHSAFLTGRQALFQGGYRLAFYAHILAGPVILVLGTAMMLSGPRSRFAWLHRRLGKLQMLLVIGILVPTGLVMARHAFAGPVATAGFTALSLATLGCALAATYSAARRRFNIHRLWATRLYLLLVSPLILRVATGFFIVTHLESSVTYQLNSWLSWLVPLAIFEVARPRPDTLQSTSPDAGPRMSAEGVSA